MHDDEFPDIIGSGSDHRVSVSEYTGNAKIPKNIVTSSEEETEARKHAFELQELAALDEKKALAAALSEHTRLPPQDAPADANIQKIANEKDTKNRQSVDDGGAVKANIQSISTESVKANVQSIGSDHLQDNIQSLARDKGLANNRQGISTDAIAPNVQVLATEGNTANNQTIHKGPAPVTNTQGIPADGTASNEQKIGKLGVPDNQQPLAGDALGSNRQPLNQAPSMAANNQAVGVDDPKLNRQAAPAGLPLAANRQAVDKSNIRSHFEALPSGSVERKKVALPANESQRSSAKPAAKFAPAPRAPLTAQELEEAKRQRDKLNDAFQGRLAGIKHNVEALNGRLTDFEEKVQQEDAKLIKGDPNDFKVDLG
jgi:hypothetical protein